MNRTPSMVRFTVAASGWGAPWSLNITKPTRAFLAWRAISSRGASPSESVECTWNAP
jgi:hypothetical protein